MNQNYRETELLPEDSLTVMTDESLVSLAKRGEHLAYVTRLWRFVRLAASHVIRKIQRMHYRTPCSGLSRT
jgi:hypothetical protein